MPPSKRAVGDKGGYTVPITTLPNSTIVRMYLLPGTPGCLFGKSYDGEGDPWLLNPDHLPR